jgi:glycerol kinase
LVLNTGDDALVSGNRLLTTVGYRLAGRTTYALEGSIFVAGAAVQWLRDSLRLVEHAGATEAIAAGCQDAGGVYLVPAFTGLGAPHWEPNARGALLGLTRDSGLAQVVTATLQSVGYQTRDLLEAMAADGTRLSTLKVDGGMTANNWMLQFLADILGIPVIRPILTETTALGVAALAGWHQGVFDTLEQLPSLGGMDRRFDPSMAPAQRERLYAGWQQALSRVLG